MGVFFSNNMILNDTYYLLMNCNIDMRKSSSKCLLSKTNLRPKVPNTKPDELYRRAPKNIHVINGYNKYHVLCFIFVLHM